MKNKMRRMQKTTAMLLTVVLMLSMLSFAAFAETNVNLIKAPYAEIDPSFESYETGAVLNSDSNGTAKNSIVSGGCDAEGKPDENGKSLSLANEGDYLNFQVGDLKNPLASATNYTLSFWMQNSVDDSLVMPQYADNAYKAVSGDGKSMQNFGSSKVSVGDWYSDFWFRGFSSANSDTTNRVPAAYFTFGEARTGEAVNVWRKVSINFTTPLEKVCGVNLTFKCAKADPALKIDAVSLVETGFLPNFIHNGNLEATREDGDTVLPSQLDWHGSAGMVCVDPTDETNRCVVFEGDATTASNNGLSSRRFFMKGKDMGTRYAISFRLMRDKAAEEVTGQKSVDIRLLDFMDDKTYFSTLTYTLGTPPSNANEWETYTMYVDATKVAALGSYFSERQIVFGDEVFQKADCKTYLDDLYTWYDSSNIGFYEMLEIQKDNDTGEEIRRVISEQRDNKTQTTAQKAITDAEAHIDVITTEKSVKAFKITDIEPVGDYRTVITRAHYLPEGKWDTDADGKTTVTFDETEIMLLSAVYKYDTEGKKTLVSIDAKSRIASAAGETINIEGVAQVPVQKEGGESYKVEAMAWDMKTMKPVMGEKAVLSE